MSSTHRLARIALGFAFAAALALGSPGTSQAGDSILGRWRQKRRAEYYAHRELGVGPAASALPGHAGVRGTILKARAENRLRQRLAKRHEDPSVQAAAATAPLNAKK